MRVLLVTKGLDLGGIERMVVDLALGLSAAGVDVEVAVVNSHRDRLAPTLDAHGITLHRLDGTDTIGLRAARRLADLVTDARFDVVHVHGPLPAVVARIATRGRRMITTSHTPWGSLRLPTRMAWRATDALDAASVAVSAAVAASLPGRARRRAIVIPHGIDPARISAAIAAAGDPHGPSTGRSDSRAGRNDVDGTGMAGITVVTVASHRDAKNYPNLLHGVQAARESGAAIRLVTIGDGPNLDAHVELAHTLGLDDVVTFRPSTDDVLAEIAKADILAVASDYEGQPIVVAEALALGLPVVATAVGRVPEMVNTAVGRVVPPRDPGALGAALAELATSPELRAEMSAAARSRLNAWTLDDVIAAHLALYTDVAAAAAG